MPLRLDEDDHAHRPPEVVVPDRRRMKIAAAVAFALLLGGFATWIFCGGLILGEPHVEAPPPPPPPPPPPEPDAGEPDAGEPDAGEPDAGEPDAGRPRRATRPPRPPRPPGGGMGSAQDALDRLSMRAAELSGMD